ncbi:unnamed protein product [Prorocentrum cordatum]|uniref:Uncharacterized protein n=1 Tax=Prorocentrum cordatum TaxID=2364126 RepID=A0ABN9QKJ0_9DINO|nr:unnamed protein product [Polarella glacialis]
MDEREQVRAGLRNLLGVEDNRMAQKLQEQCEVATDMKRCMADVEVKYKVVKEELAEKAQEVDELRALLRTSAAELEETRATVASLQAKGAEHWADKKAIEAERDHALRQAEMAKKQAQAAELKVEVELKSARAEIEREREARKKAELQAKAAQHDPTAAKQKGEKVPAP